MTTHERRGAKRGIAGLGSILCVLLSVAPAGATETSTDGLWERDTLTGTWGGLRTKLEDAGVKLGLQEQSEVWGNLAGGRQRGAAYDGLTIGSIVIDLEKLVGWTGAKAFANAYQIHGSGPTVNLTGNLQSVSSLEASRDTKLYQLWLEQTLFDGRLSIRSGQGGINDEMMSSTYSALFLSAAFGLNAMSTVNLPSGGPSYPLATPFARAEYKATDRITLFAGVFNGDPAPSGVGDPQLRDRGGVAFRANAHLLAVTEFWYTNDSAELPGTYKVGAWLHTGHFADQLRDTNGVALANPASNGIPATHSPNYAVYAIVDQTLWKKPGGGDQGVGAFLQIVGGPSGYNLSNVSFTAGLSWTGPFDARSADVLGIAVSYLGISPAARAFSEGVAFYSGSGSPYRSNETILELTYQAQLTPWWSLQPDLQIIANPGAGITSGPGGKPLGTAVITGLRVSVTF